MTKEWPERFCSTLIKVKDYDLHTGDAWQIWNDLLSSFTSTSPTSDEILLVICGLRNLLIQMNNDTIADAWMLVSPFMQLFDRLASLTEKESFILTDALYALFDRLGNMGSLKENVLFGLESVQSSLMFVLEKMVDNDMNSTPVISHLFQYLALSKFVYKAFSEMQPMRRKRQVDDMLSSYVQGFTLIRNVFQQGLLLQDARLLHLSNEMGKFHVDVFQIAISALELNRLSACNNDLILLWGKMIVDDILHPQSKLSDSSIHLTRQFLGACENYGLDFHTYFGHDANLRNKLSHEHWLLYFSSHNTHKISFPVPMSMNWIVNIILSNSSADSEKPTILSENTLHGLKNLFHMLSCCNGNDRHNIIACPERVKHLVRGCIGSLNATAVTAIPDVIEDSFFVCKQLLDIVPLQTRVEALLEGMHSFHLSPGPAAFLIGLVRDAILKTDSPETDVNIEEFLDFSKSLYNGYYLTEGSIFSNEDRLLERHSPVMQGLNLVMWILSHRSPFNLSDESYERLSDQVNQLGIIADRAAKGYSASPADQNTSHKDQCRTTSVVSLDSMDPLWKLCILQDMINRVQDSLFSRINRNDL